MTMDQFKSKGGVLQGRQERHDEFQGAPRNLGSGPDGGFGTVRSHEHTSRHDGKKRAPHGDYHDIAIIKPVLTSIKLLLVV